MVTFLYGCTSNPGMSEKEGDYDEKMNRYLTGTEIKSLIVGKTMEYPDNSRTKEYYHKSGVLYTLYEKSEDYTNGHWCIVDNKLCLDFEGMKFDCPKITIKSNGKIFYEEEGYIAINNGDKYDLKKTNSVNNWTVNKKRHCK
jgi:hypothetical protein